MVLLKLNNEKGRSDPAFSFCYVLARLKARQGLFYCPAEHLIVGTVENGLQGTITRLTAQRNVVADPPRIRA